MYIKLKLTIFFLSYSRLPSQQDEK